MRNRFWLIVILTLAASAAPYPAGAETPCQRPKAASVAEAPASMNKRAVWIDTNFSGRHLQWLGTAKGLAEGSLYVLDCKGSAIAHFNVGAVKTLTGYPGDATGSPTVMVIAQTETGTGYLEENAELIAFDGKSLRLLWSHPAYVFAAGWPWPKMKMFRQYFRFSRNRSGTKIYVSGAYLRTYPPPTTTEKKSLDIWLTPTNGSIAVVIPPEVYCWKSKKRKFAKCEKLTTAAPPIATR